MRKARRREKQTVKGIGRIGNAKKENVEVKRRRQIRLVERCGGEK